MNLILTFAPLLPLFLCAWNSMKERAQKPTQSSLAVFKYESVFEHHSSPEQLPTPELVMCIPYYEEKRKWEHMVGSSARTEAKVRVLEVFPTDLWDIFFL